MQSLIIAIHLIIRTSTLYLPIAIYNRVIDDDAAAQRLGSVEFSRGRKSAYGRFKKFRRFFTLLLLLVIILGLVETAISISIEIDFSLFRESIN